MIDDSLGPKLKDEQLIHWKLEYAIIAVFAILIIGMGFGFAAMVHPPNKTQQSTNVQSHPGFTAKTFPVPTDVTEVPGVVECHPVRTCDNGKCTTVVVCPAQ